MHSTEEANAQLYRSQAQAAYGQAQADALDAGQPWNTNMHDWCLANGWDVDRMNADAVKYGCGIGFILCHRLFFSVLINLSMCYSSDSS